MATSGKQTFGSPPLYSQHLSAREGMIPAAHEAIVNCNKMGMAALSMESYSECQRYLKKAEAIVLGL
jgi:hypothetical protein